MHQWLNNVFLAAPWTVMWVIWVNYNPSHLVNSRYRVSCDSQACDVRWSVLYTNTRYRVSGVTQGAGKVLFGSLQWSHATWRALSIPCGSRVAEMWRIRECFLLELVHTSRTSFNAPCQGSTVGTLDRIPIGRDRVASPGHSGRDPAGHAPGNGQ